MSISVVWYLLEPYVTTLLVTKHSGKVGLLWSAPQKLISVHVVMKESLLSTLTFMCPETFWVYYITGTGIIVLRSKSLLYSNLWRTTLVTGYVWYENTRQKGRLVSSWINNCIYVKKHELGYYTAVLYCGCYPGLSIIARFLFCSIHHKLTPSCTENILFVYW